MQRTLLDLCHHLNSGELCTTLLPTWPLDTVGQGNLLLPALWFHRQDTHQHNTPGPSMTGCIWSRSLARDACWLRPLLSLRSACLHGACASPWRLSTKSLDPPTIGAPPLFLLNMLMMSVCPYAIKISSALAPAICPPQLAERRTLSLSA